LIEDDPGEFFYVHTLQNLFRDILELICNTI
jgi:hypothetical protein